jgi:iron complex outermembrane recepter protein
MVPGMDVARLNANQWAISSRGFNDLYANKLLVMMDGRTIYYPVYSGVYWDSVDYILQDLDHIEVIRGPGATLWGANAVNGVINITTKSADQTQGLLSTDSYSNEGYSAALRYGGKIDDQTFYRVYGKTTDTDNFKLADGSDAHDGWTSWRSGFRIDRHPDDKNTLTLQGDFFQETFADTFRAFPANSPVMTTQQTSNQQNGQYILGRWTHVESPEADWSLQLYYDRFEHDDKSLGFVQHTVDVDFQDRFAFEKNQEFIWGLGTRVYTDSFEDTALGRLDPSHREQYRLSAFAQDDITLRPDTLHVILGSKVEENDKTGFEFEPSIKGLLTPDKRQTLWASVSHAVREPSRIERDLFAPGQRLVQQGIPVEADVVPNPHFESEKLTALELGYRVKPAERLSIDTSGFVNLYQNLRADLSETPALVSTPSPHIRVPVQFANDMRGETYGVESAATWNVTDDWKLIGSYTFFVATLHSHPASTEEAFFESANPKNQLQLRSYYNITKNFEVNAAAYYVEQLGVGIGSYVRFDAGVTWRPRENWELSVGVQNILDDRHPEFPSDDSETTNSEVPRTVFGQLTIRF